MNIHRRDFLWLSGAAAAFSAMPSFAAEDGEPLRIEVERRDFFYDVEVAPRCVLRRPVKGETPAYAYSEQTKRSVPPAWPEGAKIEVFARKGKNSLKQDEDQVGIFGKEGSPLTGKAEEA